MPQGQNMGVSAEGVAMSKSLLALLLCGVCLLAGCGGSGTGAFLQSIAITPFNPSITPGSTQQFNATGVYTDGTSSDSTGVKDLTASAIWSSSNTTVATINAAGLATGVAAGTTTIFAASGGKIGSMTLTVGN